MFIRFDLMYYLLFNIFSYASVMTFIMFFFASFAYGIPNLKMFQSTGGGSQGRLPGDPLARLPEGLGARWLDDMCR